MSQPTFELIVRFQDDPPTGTWREYIVDVPRSLAKAGIRRIAEYGADDLARDWAQAKSITNRESIAKARERYILLIEEDLRERLRERTAK